MPTGGPEVGSTLVAFGVACVAAGWNLVGRRWLGPSLSCLRAPAPSQVPTLIVSSPLALKSMKSALWRIGPLCDGQEVNTGAIVTVCVVRTTNLILTGGAFACPVASRVN
jgi:hypothetical protein